MTIWVNCALIRMALTLAQLPWNTVIPAKAGIQNAGKLSKLDSGSPLRSARNDGAFGLSKCHCALTPFISKSSLDQR